MELQTYSPNDEEGELPRDAVRKQILKFMHEMEMGYVSDLARDGMLQREAMLAIDGSLQFYGELEKNQEAFQKF